MTPSSSNDVTPEVGSEYVSRRNSLETALSRMRMEIAAGARRDSPMMTVQLTPGVEISKLPLLVLLFSVRINFE